METNEQEEKIINHLSELLESAIKKNIPEGKFGLLLSGGVDSGIIAFMLKKLGYDFDCYVVEIVLNNEEESDDIKFSRKLAEEIRLKLKVARESDVEDKIKELVNLIPEPNAVRIGISLPIFLGMIRAKKDNCKFVFVGTGSDTLFAGFSKYRNVGDINKACEEDLKKTYDKMNSREKIIAEHLNLRIIFPFLDKELADYSIKIPADLKIKDGVEKYILRKTASKIGLPKYIAERKKKAIQYSSNSQKILKKISRKNGFKKVNDYLKSLKNQKNI